MMNSGIIKDYLQKKFQCKKVKIELITCDNYKTNFFVNFSYIDKNINYHEREDFITLFDLIDFLNSKLTNNLISYN